MGNQQSSAGGGGPPGDDKSKKDKKEKPKYEPPPQPTTRIGRKKKKAAGPSAAAKLPTIYPTARCKLRYLRMQRIHDHLLLEEEYVENQERIRKAKAVKEGAAPVNVNADPEAADRNADERSRVDDMRGSPMGVGNLEELIDDDHAIVSSATGPEYYVSIMSFVDKDLLEPGASILLHHKSVSVVGVLTDDADPLVSVMKLDKAPTESYADIGGLEQQIQEVREAVELPLLHPELYEEMGIKPPKGVILYGAPGTGKTLLAKAVANQTSATFLRIVGSELIQKYLGDGPRLVRQLFQTAAENAPSIVFIDEIDAIGTKRYDSTSGGEREIQRTMLELLNQLDGFDDRGDVKVIMATNKIDTLDPALIRPGRIDRKILFENPDQHTKKKIFTLHTSKMSLNEDVDLDEFINQKDDLSGADIKAICSEAGLLALRERRMRVQMDDFRSARERVLKTKSEGEPEGLYL
ncbi:26S protease-like protein regulatory subunit 4 [Macroventuria anomochaeta]|uniref:26S protease-like protein regulatory subunit 4 n=1 Tax=Macroventuria anomochaeta TaxID=301207 RepID=A0ACB6S7Y7_9PLEO|nr:26S protease-like protein regulatory subunit 4 [Macroventuria anomochaeta]KAF2630375.1 26S protease-like protein regulatory subunit 4 [Macroventuria anomochaeta]